MTTTASAIIGTDAVAAVRRPIETAWGLPAAACVNLNSSSSPSIPALVLQHQVLTIFYAGAMSNAPITN